MVTLAKDTVERPTPKQVRELHRVLGAVRRAARRIRSIHGDGSLQYAQACQVWTDAQLAFNRARRELGDESWNRRSQARAIL